jgi:hypothetical protein
LEKVIREFNDAKKRLTNTKNNITDDQITILENAQIFINVESRVKFEHPIAAIARRRAVAEQLRLLIPQSTDNVIPQPTNKSNVQLTIKCEITMSLTPLLISDCMIIPKFKYYEPQLLVAVSPNKGKGVFARTTYTRKRNVTGNRTGYR